MIKDLLIAFIKNLETLLKISAGSIIATGIFYALIRLMSRGFSEKPLLSVVLFILWIAFMTTFLMDYRDIHKKHKGGK